MVTHSRFEAERSPTCALPVIRLTGLQQSCIGFDTDSPIIYSPPSAVTPKSLIFIAHGLKTRRHHGGLGGTLVAYVEHRHKFIHKEAANLNMLPILIVILSSGQMVIHKTLLPG